MSTTIELLVTNLPVEGSEELVVELWLDREEMAYLDEGGTLTLWPRTDGQPWKVNHTDFLEALVRAKERLAG